MNFATTALLALAMSADAFAAAIGKGAALHKPRFAEALRTGLIFGVIEGITPVIGWALGLVAAPFVSAWDHWIAFALLGGLGLVMIRNGCKPQAVSQDKRIKHSFWLLAATGFATSIDAMAVGVGLAFIDVNIVSTSVAIGCTTLLMVVVGVMLGRLLGSLAGRRAEVVGGAILIGIGTMILVDHLGLTA
ncbi:manganese efflux pump MntP [Pollutimonas thiosulfatoxidans]|uniref:Putative manganese efflux pump MntP n=1 Tax=Pollutimonas thiosulfatoxidans TaxID=2028345 RepID=A0A410GBL7_9BURK|nr:manganese efflux pump MntP [Pollutimonas thiosulfatoxidans]MBF6617832.1 manganese efflux pump MntP [Candidimonas sp.]NYT46123.1 manganese efflux pump MntP [Alcaligenaceae bacterium]QAA93681.1 hypothetical protein CKA81_07395 [Pollutimonas thiosulfatoxidans]